MTCSVEGSLQSTSHPRSGELAANSRPPFDAMSDAVWTIDPDTDAVVSANGAVELLTGHTLDALIGRSASALTPESGSEAGVAFDRDVWRRPGLYEAVVVARADGFGTCVSLHVAHRPTPGGYEILCVARDDTERRMLERELITKHMALRQAHDELERRVQELARMRRELELRNDELTDLSARMASVTRRAVLSEIVAEVAHGMNNPLAALHSSLRMLRRADADGAGAADGSERRDQLVERCVAASERLTAVVDELRLACRGLSHTPGECPEADLAAEVASAIAFLRTRVPEGVCLENAVHPVGWVKAGADEIQHAVLNLLDNAFDAVEGRGFVRVTTDTTGDGAVLAVADSGPGIAPELVERVFDPFFTTKPPRRGTGLGLSMIRRMARRHGGDAWAVPHGTLGGAVVHLALRRAEHA